jgi:hypothetical protein
MSHIQDNEEAKLTAQQEAKNHKYYSRVGQKKQ